ncbi:cation diffusion facilitator family transporter [Parvularcula marina]|uniref:Protein p34 n=1 Tax=Parvularcula marina TaxID=2292771 RepID=A0A371REV0_9PROT|nr:cation diffusion facilitator family transporter [Parvularcula marina]RFB03965.1 cation transporter [Parvularcula marina]
MTGNAKADRAKWARIATLWSVATAFILATAKAVAWQQSGSVAILGSLADSFLDLLASGIAFIGVRMAAQPADANHRFGHDKAEAISSLVQLVLITGSAVFVLVESIQRLMNPQPLLNTDFALGIMLLSLALTVVLVSVQTYAVRKSGSMATESDRAHYVGDFIGNAGTLFAVILVSQFGLLWADGFAGLIAAGFLFWSVWEISRRALPQLMDEELSDDERYRIERLVLEDEEVFGLHALRTRKAGSTPYIQFHLELDPEISLRHAHEIAARVDKRLREEFPGADLIIHQDLSGMTESHDAFGQFETVIEEEEPA